MSDEYDLTVTHSMPVLPLRGLTVYPGMMLNFDVERQLSSAALNNAVSGDRMVFLAAQKDITKEMPQPDDICAVGTVCKIKQVLRQPGTSTVKVMAEGVMRGRASNYIQTSPCLVAEVEQLADSRERVSKVRMEALLRRCCSLFAEYVKLIASMPEEVILNIVASEDASYVSYYISQNLVLRPEEKQKLLEETRPSKRLYMLVSYLARAIDILEEEHRIAESTQEQMVRSQRDFYLREQIKAIEAELGEGGELTEADEYKKKIAEGKFPEEVRAKMSHELSRLSRQQYGSAEASVIRGWLDTCLELPWDKKSRQTLDIKKARRVLDADHYGLDKVKERVVEYLAVRRLSPAETGSVLCLVGPPGTGKTSVAMSVARATNRKLARVSLGGVHDEAEIRGHRKTYVGSMPGRLISGIQQAGTQNPLMVLDEVDKLGSDYRGDPAAALLEALDTEQNWAFRDNYLELPFDLSKVFFITTANTTDTIPRALLDRMEVIELPGYTDEEKLQIAKRHLLPKQRKKHGLTVSQLKISDAAIREITALYTREAGVRELERELAALCRKAATGIVEGTYKSLAVNAGSLSELLGVPRYIKDSIYASDEIGLVRGLAWTAFGGEVLDVEAGVVDGTGKLELTGNLGDVMKESAQAAVTYIRSHAREFGIETDFYKNKDIHIHFPEGAIPKDGPSAGLAICMSLVSALTGVPAHRDVAMTGEITLNGRILPIGGLREKTMAALRSGIEKVIIPSENVKDLEEIDKTVRAALNIIAAGKVDDVIGEALLRMPGTAAEKGCAEERKLNAIPENGVSGGRTASIRQ